MTDHNVEIEDGIGIVKGVDTEPTAVPDWGLDENGFMTEEYLATVPVKGPDPEVWGDDDDRPTSEPYTAAEQLDEEGNPMEIKGPDPEQHPQNKE